MKKHTFSDLAKNNIIKILELLEKEKCIILMESCESWEKVAKLTDKLISNGQFIDKALKEGGFVNLNLYLMNIPILYHKGGIQALCEEKEELTQKLNEANIWLSFYKKKCLTKTKKPR